MIVGSDEAAKEEILSEAERAMMIVGSDEATKEDILSKAERAIEEDSSP